MSALTSLLARDAVVPLSTIEDALQRQVLEGGELDTALLELDALDENVVGSYRAAAFGLVPVSRAELMWVDAITLGKLPAEMAAQHRVVPLSVRDGLLTLAAKGPLEPSQLVELQRELDTAVDVRIATEVRLEAALALHYGTGIAGRLRLLAARLEAREPGELRAVPPLAFDVAGTGAVQLDLDAEDEPALDEDVDPGGFRDDPTARTQPQRREVGLEAARPKAPAARPVEVVPVVALGDPRSQRPAASPTSSRPPRGALRASMSPVQVPTGLGALAARREPFPGVPMGPLTPERARELFDLAETRDHVVGLFFAFARQYFDASALFSVRDGRVTGIEGVGLRGVERVEQVSVELVPHSALEESLRGLLPRVVGLDRKREDRPLAAALGRLSDQPAALLPVPIRQRAVLFLYGDRHGRRFGIEELAALVAMLPVVGRSFERIIHERKVFAREVKESFRPGPPASMPAGVGASSAAGLGTSLHGTQSGLHPPKLPVMPGLDGAGETEATAPLPPGVRIAAQAAAPEPPPPPAPQETSGSPDGSGSPEAVDLSRVDEPFQPSPLTSPMARQALSSLGLRGDAPLPPDVPLKREVSLDELEGRPTIQLEAAKGGTLPRLSPASSRSLPPLPTRQDTPGAYRASDLPPEEGARVQRSQPAPATGEPIGEIGPADGRGRTPRRRRRSETTRPDRPSTRPLAPELARSPQPVPDSAAFDADPVVSREPPEPRTLSEAPPGAGSYSVRGASEEIAGGDARVSKAPADKKPASPRAPAVEKPASQRPAAASPVAPERPATPTASADRAARRADPRRDTSNATPIPDVVSRSAVVRDSLPPAPRRQSPRGSIVIDLSPDAHALIDELCTTGPDDQQPQIGPLLRLGDVALEAIEARFPGPLWFSRSQLHMRFPAGRDISALARVLLACEDRGVAVLQRLVCSPDVEVRLCATLLAADWVHAALLPAFCDRLFDPDGQIRRIASSALPVYCNVRGFDAMVDTLRRRAVDTKEPIPTRLSALEAISVLRDAGSVELLMELQHSKERQISVPAHRALVGITAQDFGTAKRKWASWFDKSRGSHRVEWLIDALMHSDERLRAIAGGELQKLTQVYYGYAASAPKRSRERSQERYREWWEAEGRRLFR